MKKNTNELKIKEELKQTKKSTSKPVKVNDEKSKTLKKESKNSSLKLSKNESKEKNTTKKVSSKEKISSNEKPIKKENKISKKAEEKKIVKKAPTLTTQNQKVEPIKDSKVTKEEKSNLTSKKSSPKSFEKKVVNTNKEKKEDKEKTTKESKENKEINAESKVENKAESKVENESASKKAEQSPNLKKDKKTNAKRSSKLVTKESLKKVNKTKKVDSLKDNIDKVEQVKQVEKESENKASKTVLSTNVNENVDNIVKDNNKKLLINGEKVYQINDNLGKENKVVEKQKIKVLYVASECQPFVATGGLGDVAGSLPKEIAKTGKVDIRVVLPLYANIKETYSNSLEFIGWFTTHLAWRQEYCGIFKLVVDGVIYYFIDNERYFKREKPYGFYDDGERFAFFCKSIVEGLPCMNFMPDIIHCNDWQSALVSTYIKTGNWSDLRYYNIKNVYTIHNVEYQGVYGMENLNDLFGIDYKFKNFVEYNGDINLAKGAIQFSDKFTTVSDSYCDNLKEYYCSGGLNYIITRNEYKLSGILNGIDYDFYNPRTDKIIYANYDINSFKEGKAKNKLGLQKDFGLEQNENIPLISIVSRLVSHKGIGLLTKVLDDILKKNVQLIVVGTGDEWYVNYFNSLQKRYPNKVRALVDRYYGDLARKAYAASDIFLMPSKIEPCGISQMIASRYGSIPIVREVGGLKDTIKDFGCVGGGNGYTFTYYNPNDFYNQICRALNDYKNKKLWALQVKTVMSQDFSWSKSALKYVDLYKSLV